MKIKNVVTFLFVVFFVFFNLIGNNSRESSFILHKKIADSSMFKNLKWENVGPYFQGGRIVDIEAYGNDDFRFLIASASGGLWLTENNGTTWKSIFDKESSISIGDIAISQTDKNLIWVGTGEANSSRSSYAGTGIFKSVDSGKTWTNMGLTDSQHISRIVIDPKNNNVVFAAVIGHLYTPNEERGVFKTTDGGKTWNKILYINKTTGVIDLVMDPKNPDILYASSWEKTRKAWNLVESGIGSCIYKTINGGKDWKKMVNGLPIGKYTGRIGLALSKINKNVLYALIDNQKPRPIKKEDKKKGGSGITVDLLMKMNSENFLKIENSKLEKFLIENKAPESISVEMVKGMVKSGNLNPQMIAKMLSDANSRLLNSNVIGAEVYKSQNGGESWVKTHQKPLPKWMYSTYGYYFGQIRVSPDNDNILYIMGVPLLKSTDGGKTFKDISTQGGIYGENGVHADMHAMWIDKKNPKRILLGNDGGLNITYDGGKSWVKIDNLPIAQCYTVDYDMADPFNIYSGLQDNGVVKGPSNFRFGDRVNIWKRVLGGDGAYVSPEPKNPEIVYAEFQFGNIFRVDLKNKKVKKIQPVSKNKRSPFRFNWLSPFKISNFNPYIMYMGANKVLKSVNRGKDWVELSPDLTDKKHINGDVPYATIVSLDDSPLSPEIIYAGTDDGNIWITKNSGANWEKISNGIPKKWVSKIAASAFKKGRVFITLTGYRDDDFKSYIYKSENFGKDWISIKSNLPDEPANVIREDSVNENILYLGTDLTAYVSLNGGTSWESLRANLPTIPVYDIKVHPRDKKLIIATHGRGIFLLPLNQIQVLNNKMLKKELFLFESEKIFKLKTKQRYSVNKILNLNIFSNSSGKVLFKLKNKKGKTVKKTIFKNINRGLNYLKLVFNLKKEKIKKGKYRFMLYKGKIKVSGTVDI